MKANELIIGNIVESLHTNERPNEWVEIVVNAEHIKTCSEHPEWFIGIVLTESLMLKLGARKVNHINGYSFMTFSNSKTNARHVDIYVDRTTYYGYHVIHCEYLHQLQKLFSVTGSELKMKAEG